MRRRALSLYLLLREGLLRRGGAHGRTLERFGTRLRHEPRGVRVTVLEVVDQRAPLAVPRIALLLFGTAQLFRSQLALSPLGLLLLFQRLRVRLFALLVELDERCVFFSVGRDARLRFWDIDIIDEVEGCVEKVCYCYRKGDKGILLMSSTSCR